MNHELKVMAAVFTLNALMLALLLTAMLGLLPTPQAVLQSSPAATAVVQPVNA